MCVAEVRIWVVARRWSAGYLAGVLVYEEYFLASMSLVVFLDDLLPEFARADLCMLAVLAAEGQNQR
jgi:hypothetical protein